MATTDLPVPAPQGTDLDTFYKGRPTRQRGRPPGCSSRRIATAASDTITISQNATATTNDPPICRRGRPSGRGSSQGSATAASDAMITFQNITTTVNDPSISVSQETDLDTLYRDRSTRRRGCPPGRGRGRERGRLSQTTTISDTILAIQELSITDDNSPVSTLQEEAREEGCRNALGQERHITDVPNISPVSKMVGADTSTGKLETKDRRLEREKQIYLDQISSFSETEDENDGVEYDFRWIEGDF